MLVTRWQAPLVPKKSQIFTWFAMEGLEPQEVEIKPDQALKDLRRPFDEVIMVARGQLNLDIAGNKLLLREGDKIVIPSNTRHSKSVSGTEPCLYISAQTSY